MGDAHRPRGLGGRACAAAMAMSVVFAAGCAHHEAVGKLPPAATAPAATAATGTAPAYPAETTTSTAQQGVARGGIPITPIPRGGVSMDDLYYIEQHKPLFSETGDATWYTAPYKGRKAANGEVFSDRALTAAHRTLPMGSLIVVTNLKTGQSSPMRISDRGPFSPDKIIDLTMASARATGVYRMGVAPVRVDVYWTPKPVETGGRWCVQIGAFTSERKAIKLKQKLLDRYPDARVIEFSGERSYWVRIRPEGDNREQAEFIAEHLHPSQGDAYLTRLD
ncbi:MAG TPA: septal ring lytic transglycosylase RlpA family protein [Terracidiphilus sp.]|nr:septal ring lytic transglycosylase RlpA family protein [Terracidiphilus sp.]